MTSKQFKILKSAYKIIEKDWENPKCEGYDLGCLHCQMRDFLKQYKSLIEFIYEERQF